MNKLYGPFKIEQGTDSVATPGSTWEKGIRICAEGLVRYFDFSEAPYNWSKRVLWMTVSDRKIKNALKVRFVNSSYLKIETPESLEIRYTYRNFYKTLKEDGFSSYRYLWIRMEFE